MLLNELLTHNSLTGLAPPNSLMVTPAMQQQQQQMTISGVDPFLGQTVLGPDAHIRQNSGDSGLGNCYSLPRTPEDFLGNIDSLDRHDISESSLSLLKFGVPRADVFDLVKVLRW